MQSLVSNALFSEDNETAKKEKKTKRFADMASMIGNQFAGQERVRAFAPCCCLFRVVVAAAVVAVVIVVVVAAAAASGWASSFV